MSRTSGMMPAEIDALIEKLEAELAAIRTDPIHESWESKSREELLAAFRWQGQMTAAQADMVAKYRQATLVTATSLQVLADQADVEWKRPRDEKTMTEFQDRVTAQVAKMACYKQAREILDKSVNLCLDAD